MEAADQILKQQIHEQKHAQIPQVASVDKVVNVAFEKIMHVEFAMDVNDLAAGKLKSGDVVGSKALKSSKGKTQDPIVDGVSKACGVIVSKGHC